MIAALCPCSFFMTSKLTLLSILPWTQLNLNLELKKRLNFNDFLWLALLEIFQIQTKYARLERISPNVSLFETFARNRLFACNHHQTIKQRPL